MIAELAGAKVKKKSYIIVARLPDGTTVNEVTHYVRSGHETYTEIECDRPITQEELDAVLRLTSSTDVALAEKEKPISKPARYQVRHTF